VAERFGLATHVLRHWESEGLLPPVRDGDRRRYTDADQNRVAAILLAKAQAAMAMLEGALTCPHDDIMTCPTFQEHLGTASKAPTPAR
jgi:MerR family transcriptional regulator, copper efflux regulator